MEQLSQISNIAFWTALCLYAVAMVFDFYYLGFRREGAWKIANVLSWAGLAVQAVSVVTRGIAAGHLPWGNMYEYSSIVALIMVAVEKLVVELRYKVRTVAGFVLLAAVATMLIAGTALYRDPGPLVPALDSAWLMIHVILVITASALLMLGAGVLSPLFLVKVRQERRGAAAIGATRVPRGESEGATADDPPGFEPGADEPVGSASMAATATATVAAAATAPPGAGSPLLAKRGILPPSETLDRLAYRTIAVGFVVWTFAVIAGAIWAQRAWGRYWGWDPKEVWAFITWVVFAGYLHARATAGWKGTRAALLASVGFVVVLFTYYVVNIFIVGLHSYAGVS
ncbi:MAG: c-type cytochrome biogenesis protein CcsB [Actinomycetota bacterium]